MPNGSSGARAMVRTMVEQFGLVTRRPFQPRAFCWTERTARCSGLISGTRSGTSGSMRWLRELDNIGSTLGHFAVEPPGGCVAEFLAGGTIAGAQPGELKPGVALQKSYEMLPNHPGTAENSNFDRCHRDYQNARRYCGSRVTSSL